MSELVLSEVTVLRRSVPLFTPVDMVLRGGEIACLVGRSGAGKSSLLSLLCGVLPSALRGVGTVTLNGRQIDGLPTEQRRVGLMFQDDLLFPHLSVAGNVAFGLRCDEGGRSTRAGAIDEALREVGLAGMGGNDPATLSGGQRARVSLLRVLVSRPHALLLDEPFGSLDRETRCAVRELTFSEARRRNLPTLLVTHDEDDLRAAAGPVHYMRPLVEP